jgi:hypothetical protein
MRQDVHTVYVFSNPANSFFDCSLFLNSLSHLTYFPEMPDDLKAALGQVEDQQKSLTATLSQLQVSMS